MNPILLTKKDAYLKPYEKTIKRRMENAVMRTKELAGNADFSEVGNGYLYYGLHRCPDCWVLREWAPGADVIYVIGDFSNWEERDEYRMQRLENGNWEIKLPLDCVDHGSLYKLFVKWRGGEAQRIPAYAQRVVQDPDSKIFSAQVWRPKQTFRWKHKTPVFTEAPLIYEVHVGMSSEIPEVGTFQHFRTKILPRIVDGGYNYIQLMAIQEHPYYGSFGYQVSSFFAVSSRFGTPEDLKQLIDDAHGYGVGVILDIVHSHSVSNEAEGLSKFDGTSDLYFHSGERGEHPAWGSRCFNYGKGQVLSFLLSNCKYWMEEFHFDGFRFDGVTSMIYFDHGLGRDFTDYKAYYDGNQDEDALTYLCLANKLIHTLNPSAITIAEDVSGLPGLAYPFEGGGIGFDYRMSMGIPDYWIKTIKEKRDEEWHVGNIFYEMTNKRADEKTISYAESHDQAMVGDKTIIFRLIDKDMYTSMNVFERNIIVDRGIALHKMIRLLTISTAGDGYLNFMGNEFGHPEWIDFPREGNNWSYHYARRQWSLRDDPNLRYRFLGDFDKDMITLIKKHKTLYSKPFPIVQNTSDQVLIFSRGNLLFVFNFSPNRSYSDYGFRTDNGEFRTVLNTDNEKYDGFGIVDESVNHISMKQNNDNWLRIYVPSRTAMVLERI